MDYTIEGAWEEIKRHEAEFAGQRLRVTILPPQKPLTDSELELVPKPNRRVSAMGKYAGVLSSEEFMRRKQEEIDHEERSLP